jgi:hypothetical protein
VGLAQNETHERPIACYVGADLESVWMGEVKRSLGCLLLLALGASSLGCHHDKKEGAPSASASAEAVATAAPSVSGLEVAPAAMLEPATRVGAALARSPDGKRLYVADEDRKLLHVLRLPLTGAPVASVSLPGAPAQVVVLADRVLVTIRHPSLLWVGRTEGDNVTELGRASPIGSTARAQRSAFAKKIRSTVIFRHNTQRPSNKMLSTGRVVLQPLVRKAALRGTEPARDPQRTSPLAVARFVQRARVLEWS